MHPSIHTYVQAGIHTAHTVLVTENTYNMMHAFYILYKSKRVRIHVYIYTYVSPYAYTCAYMHDMGISMFVYWFGKECQMVMQ